MRIIKSYNENPKGIQLEFDPKLSHTDLENYLISIGFRNSNRNKSVWYVRGDRPSFDRYTSTLEKANKEGKDLSEVKIEPSYEAIRGNIDHKLFSLVTASIEVENQEIKEKDYVVFEDFRISAEDIAKRFLTSQLGDKFKELKVTAKNFKEKARNAFDEGRIITAISEDDSLASVAIPKDKSIWQKTTSEYLLEILGENVSKRQLLDPEFLAVEKHEHKIALLTALRNGEKVHESVLQDHPKLLERDNFQFGFDGTDFGTSKAFLELLKGIGNTGDFIKGEMVDGGRPGFLWEGDNIKIVTAKNPIFNNGYASFIGIEGFREQVLDLVNLIEGQTNSVGELGLNYVSFNDYDFLQGSPTYLTDDKGIYTEETAGDRFEILTISFPKMVKFEASIRLVQDDKDEYVYGLNVVNGLEGMEGYSFLPSRIDFRYPSREEAIKLAILQIIDGVQFDHTNALENGASETLKTAYHKTIQAIYDFADNLKIKLPVDQSQAVLPLSIEGEEFEKKEKTVENTQSNAKEDDKQIALESKELETEEEDKGLTAIIKNTSQQPSLEVTKTGDKDTKRDIVRSMIDSLTALGIDTEGITETIISTFRLALEEALEIEDKITFAANVTQTIEDQKDWIDDIEPEAVRNTFLDLILSNAKALGYIPFIVPHSSCYILKQAWTKLDIKTVQNFEEFINSRPNLMEHKYYPEDSIPYGYKISSDQDEITFQVLDNNHIAISSHSPMKEGVNYGGSTISNSKLKKAIQYILSNPTKVVVPLKTEEKQAKGATLPVTIDMERYGTKIPNVLSPERVIGVFNSGLYVKEAKKIQEVAPYLFQASDDTLSELSAKELFELVQMSHPTEYGFSVSRSAILREWEKRGQELFEELGFPIDMDYPYVNINTGYKSVYPLKSIINEDQRVIWWSAASMYRPIADLEKAIDIIEEEKTEFKNQQLPYTNPKTGKPKSKKEEKNSYREIEYKIEDLDNSKELIQAYIDSKNRNTEAVESDVPKQIQTSNLEEFFFIKPTEVAQIRMKFSSEKFTMPFNGKQAFGKNVSIIELNNRYQSNALKLKEKKEKEFDKWIAILEKDLEKLKKERTAKSKTSVAHRVERIEALLAESKKLEKLVEDEHDVFRDELFYLLAKRAEDTGYVLLREDVVSFRDFVLDHLFGVRILENYPNEPISKMARILIDDFFAKKEKKKEKNALNPDYVDIVVAIMHDHYIRNERLSKKKIEAVKEQAGAPNLGVLWEAVELSWLLWYKQIYNLPIPFEQRLAQMVEFWNTVQPTYSYSDSSKELFKQYSTPCPIGAMIAEYTQMSNATTIFEPSAGNGLLVMGAAPIKTHVNEIDNSRRYSLELQGFDTITHLNAAEPFPEELTHFFDVMVTNPPFASWEDSKFDKERWTQKYFNNQIGLAQHMRLEHFMAGLALHTLKDTGKAAIIIMGHVYFGQDGYIRKYKPFFNWLYRHYRVDDIINMNSYKLYNKQGAVAKTMLILINGRKQIPEGIAPTKRENPSIEQMVDSFPELWDRVNSHIEKDEQYKLEVIITQLKIELGL